MVSSISASPFQFVLNFFPNFIKCHFIKVAPLPQASESLAKRKFSQIFPTLSRIASYSPETLNQGWSRYLDEVSKEIFSSTDLDQSAQNELKKVLQSLDLKNMELFFNRLSAAEIEKPSSQAVEEVLKLIDVRQIEACIKAKNPFFNGSKSWASELEGLPKEGTPPKVMAVQAERTHNVIGRFFPNLGHVLLKAFNIFNSERPPATLYEYGVLLTMYYQFFFLPYLLFKGLSAVIASPVIVLLTATLIICLAVGALYTYLRWIKKCPKEVVFCDNLSEQHRQKRLASVVGRDEEFQQALACLASERRGTTTHLLIVGEPGVGKTEFLNGLAQRLPEREIFKFRNWSLFGSAMSYQSAGEKMEEAFSEVRGFEQKSIFACDELGDAQDKIADFLKPTLNNQGIQFVGTMTKKQYDGLDQALKERFKVVFLKPTDKKQTLRILEEKVKNSAPHISYSEAALEKIYELSQGTGYCQPRNGISIIDAAINRIQQFKIEEYTTSEYWAALEALKGIKAHGLSADSPLRRPMSQECIQYLSQRDAAQRKVEECERQLRQKRDHATRVFQLNQQERALQREIEGLLKPITENKASEHQIRRFLLNSFFVYPQLGEKIEQIASNINKEMPLRIDVSLVEKLVQEELANRQGSGG